jgi:phosphomannomutase
VNTNNTVNTTTPEYDAVIATARAWQKHDPDDETKAELQLLIEDATNTDNPTKATNALAELHARFNERLAFGTAGLRGKIGAGPNRMNRIVVSQTAAGLAAYLLENAQPHKPPSVVIGYDGRKNSRIFATDTAELMAGAGVRTILLPRLLPTPVLAFAVRHFAVSAGVMVTASHNPAADNGYKVYLGGDNQGCQIIPPVDAEIAAHIQHVADPSSMLELPRTTQYEIADESIIDAYIAKTAAVSKALPTPLNTVYTPLHGVGWETAQRVFAAAGFTAPTLVAAQINPDPNFSTVSFPNPEEPGAMDRAFHVASKHNAELIIANDPDADRLAVAIPDPHAPEKYRRLTGNEVGALLGWYVAERAENSEGTLACSIVSSPALRSIADAYSLTFTETLTGFKWISRTPGLIFGYEEALGYLINPQTVGDKDGISAAVAVMSLASELKNKGLTLADQLHRFSEQFGHFASSQISVRTPHLSTITEIMTSLRQNFPSQVGGVPVTTIEDLSNGFGNLPPSNVLRIFLTDSSRIMVRPSGTEPKLKIYIDVHSVHGSGSERKHDAEARLSILNNGMHELLHTENPATSSR